MSFVDSHFLQTGLKWDSSELENLTFTYSNEIPAILRLQTEYLKYFELSSDAVTFSSNADPEAYDQKDLIRFFLLKPEEINNFSGPETINLALVNDVRTQTQDGFENYRISFSEIINVNFLESSDGDISLINAQGLSSQTQSIAFLPQEAFVGGDIVMNYLDPGNSNLVPGGIQAYFYDLCRNPLHNIYTGDIGCFYPL
jgi:hypothetical protein